MTANLAEAQQTVDAESTEQAKQLASDVLHLIYEEWESVWNSYLNTEKDTTYRLIPKPVAQKKTRVAHKILNGFRVAFQTKSTPSINETKSENTKNAWGIAIQREPDDSATIFYAGVIPGSSEFADKPGLKIIHASRDGRLSFGIFDISFDGSLQLPTTIHNWSNGNGKWKDKLNEFASLDPATRKDVANCLSQGVAGSTTVLDEINRGIKSREEGPFAHSISDYPQ